MIVPAPIFLKTEIEMDKIIEKLYKKITKIGEKWGKGPLGRIVDDINNDPDKSWAFISLVLILGGFGIVLCLLWFYFLIKQGMPVGWIIFDSAIVIFCVWAIIRGIIPMSKEAYKLIDEKREKQNSVQESDDVHKK